ncbi:MAG: redox-sensing transcriptional repressor Rex [Planctomycetaceae bacterium]|jgi:redox-sensing transcriptional repressor|nr:redox-sensing transcriptional repressor Rex [Planctomycetaceae bacterium]
MLNVPVKSFPIPSIQRLPVYLRFLEELHKRGETLVSCTQIADEFGQLSVQVRKDLSITGITGRPKIGYNVAELIDTINKFLGWDKTLNAFLIGAGNLGNAILGYERFAEHGLNIVAAFDSDPQKIGQKFHGKPVYDFGEIAERGKDAGIKIGILTVPPPAAQVSADALIFIGVQAIWNYTPVKLDLPPEVIYEDVKFSASFAVLSSRLKSSTASAILPPQDIMNPNL